MAYSTNGLGRYLDYLGGKSSLSNKEKEAANLIVNQVNGCRYCQSAHTVLGKMNGLDENEIIQIRKGSSTDDKLNALVALAGELNEKKGHASSEAVQHFFDQGYSKENLVDLILLISEKTAMNYLHNLTQVEIDFPVAPEL